MREDLQTEISSATTLLDVLLILKKVTMLDTHVATLAYVTEEEAKWNGNHGTIKCKPFPLNKEQEEYTIQAYYFNQNSSFNEGDIVVILFMDRNFINNLSAVDKKPKQTKDLTTHTYKFGIVIQTK